jgi:hypothetical protein
VLRITDGSSGSASPRSGARRRRNGQKCPRCKHFGTFAPNTIVCDRCMGTLPLIFTVTVMVIGGGSS